MDINFNRKTAGKSRQFHTKCRSVFFYASAKLVISGNCYSRFLSHKTQPFFPLHHGNFIRYNFTCFYVLICNCHANGKESLSAFLQCPDIIIRNIKSLPKKNLQGFLMVPKRLFLPLLVFAHVLPCFPSLFNCVRLTFISSVL